MSCGIITIGGNPPGGGGADPSAFSFDFQTVGAAVQTTTLATLVPNGSRVLLRSLTVSMIFAAGVPAGDIGELAYAGAVQAQRGTTDAQVVFFGTQPWGPPPGTAPLQPTSVGYQPPLAFGSPGGILVALAVAGSNFNLAGTGILGFTIQWNVRGLIEVFAGAVRVI